MELVRIIAIHPIILFYLVIFHLDLVASRPALFPSGRLQEPNVRQAEESLGSRERTELSLNDKLAISLSIGLVALLIIFSTACFIGYKKQWHRRPLRENYSNHGDTTGSMQTLPHHPLYKECLHPTNTNPTVTSPDIPQTVESSPFLYHPYIPSPITSYFQPADVYRTITNVNDSNSTRGRSGYPSPPTENPLTLNPTGPRTKQSFSEPPPPKTVPKPREDTIDPVIRSTTIPTYSPQPRRCFGLPPSPRQRPEFGLGVTCPPQAVIRGQP